jgi:di/tricarboxylate transporter
MRCCALFVSERIRIEISALIVLMALVVLFELMPLTPAPGQPPLDTGRLIAGLANPALVAVMALLVMGPGYYRFKDFLRVGGPLVVVIWIAFSLIAPWYYGL